MSAIAVVIPARDAAPYLAQALDSVLGQTVAPTEVVVVDDGSSDDTAEIAAARGGPVRVVCQPPRGISAAVNRGVSETTAPLVAMLDADDLWTTDKLAAQTEAFERDPALELVFGHAEEFVSPDLAAVKRAALRPRPPAPFRAKGTMLARRAAFERVGEFDTELTMGDFVDWCSRADDAGLRSLMLERVVLRRRLHGDNHGRLNSDRMSDYAAIARRHLQRQREAS